MSSSMLQRIAAGDASAVRDCIAEFGGLVWNLARRMSRTASDAEDATQEIFLDVWRSAHRFDPLQGSERVFISLIARRRLIDRLRKSSAEPPMDPAEVLDTMGWSLGPSVQEQSADADFAARALSELRPEQREVMELNLLQGLTHAEIAERLKLPLGTVKSYIRRGITRVQESLRVDSIPLRSES